MLLSIIEFDPHRCYYEYPSARSDEDGGRHLFQKAPAPHRMAVEVHDGAINLGRGLSDRDSYHSYMLWCIYIYYIYMGHRYYRKTQTFCDLMGYSGITLVRLVI